MAEATPGPGIQDLGLQLERTALAWRRTALALVAAALIAVKAMALRETMALGLVSASLLAIAAGAAWVGPLRYRHGGELFAGGGGAESPATAPGLVRSATGGLALAISSGAVALVGIGAIAWASLRAW
jgi:hypothetical protein